MDFLTVITRFFKFCEKSLPLSTSKGCMIKLQEEIKEVEKAETIIEKQKEYVDCLLLIFHAANKDGISPEYLIKGMYIKTLINEERTWKYNGDETYSHVKENFDFDAIKAASKQIDKAEFKVN